LLPPRGVALRSGSPAEAIDEVLVLDCTVRISDGGIFVQVGL
jgi:hypothetical protein